MLEMYHLGSKFLLSLLSFTVNCNLFLEATVSPSSGPRVKSSYTFGRTFLGLDKCNACIGTSICKKFFKEEIRSESPYHIWGGMKGKWDLLLWRRKKPLKYINLSSRNLAHIYMLATHIILLKLLINR